MLRHETHGAEDVRRTTFSMRLALAGLLAFVLCFTARADQLLGRAVFTNPGISTYSVPAGTSYLIVKCWGGGGGAYGMGGYSYGGFGGYASAKFLITSGNWNILVGSGGSNGWGNGGTGAGASQFGWNQIGFGSGGGGGGSGDANGWYSGDDAGGTQGDYGTDGSDGGPDYGGSGGTNGRGIAYTAYNYTSTQGFNTNDPDYQWPVGQGFGYYDFDGHNGMVIVYAYSISVAAAVNNPGTLTANQKQYVSYSISATGSPSPSSYGASGLPPGLSVNTSTGAVAGYATTPGSYTTTFTASNGAGTGSATFTWVVVAANISPNGSVSPQAVTDGASVTLYRDASANFGVAYTDGTIWKPNGQYDSLGIQSLGSQSYTPNAGPGSYSWQYRVVDSYGNFVDQNITFTVQAAPTASVSFSPPSIVFGQSSTVTMTLEQSSPGSLAAHWMLWDQGNGSYWTGIGFGWNYASSTTGMTSISSLDGTPAGANSSTKSFIYTPNYVGSTNFLSWGVNNAGATPNWSQTALTISKATPAAAFPTASWTGTHTVAAGELNAAFSNPYSGGVTPPGGATYSISGLGTVGAGTVLLPGTYTVTASFPGNANYNAASATSTWTVTNRPPDSATIGALPATLLLGQSLSLSGSLHDPDGNLFGHFFWFRGARPADTFAQDWNGWMDGPRTGAALPAGWSGVSNSPNYNAVTNATTNSVAATFTPTAPGYWQFHANGYDAMSAWGPGATTGSVFVAPAPTVNVAVTATNGASSNGDSTITITTDDTLTISENVTSAGWVSGTGILYWPGTMASPAGGVVGLGGWNESANSSATNISHGATWKPGTPGTYTIYVEAFTGRTPGERVNGACGYPGYYNPANRNLLCVQVNVVSNPTVALQICDAAGNPLSAQGDGNVHVNYGTQFRIKFTGNHAQGLLVSILGRFQKPGGVQAGAVNGGYIWNGAGVYYYDLGVSGATAVNFSTAVTADVVGTWTLWGHDYVSGASSWGAPPGFNGSNFGWGSIFSIPLVVDPGPPTAPSSFQPSTTGSTLVTLSWQAAFSPIGIARYDIYRGGSLIGSSTTTSFTDSATTPSSSYNYTIRAVDTANVVSATASVSVTTLASFELFTPAP